MKTHPLISAIVIVVLLLGLSGCGKEPILSTEEKNMRGSIYGIVVDDNNLPVSGVSISTDGNGYTSGSDKNGMFTIPDVPKGTYSIQVNHYRYAIVTIPNITIANGENVQVDTIHLSELFGTISGTVRDNQGAPVSNVSVILKGDRRLTTMTSSNGTYSITSVPIGFYECEFSHPLYSDTTVDSIAITPDTLSRPLPDINLKTSNSFFVERDIYGTITGNTALIQKIEVVISGDSIPAGSPIKKELSWSKESGSFSGFVLRPRKGAMWKATIYGYDSTGKVISYKKTYFNSFAGDVSFSTFDAENAKPIITINSLPDSTWFTGQKIRLPFSCVDSFETNRAQFFYRTSDNESFLPCDSGMVEISVPDTALNHLSIIIKAVDSDGNTTFDTTFVRANLFALPPKSVSDSGFGTIIPREDGTFFNICDARIELRRSNGEVVWDKQKEIITVIGTISSNNSFFACKYDSLAKVVRIERCDTTLSTIWTKEISIDGDSANVLAVAPLNTNDYLICYRSNKNSTSTTRITAIRSDGTEIWTKIVPNFVVKYPKLSFEKIRLISLEAGRFYLVGDEITSAGAVTTLSAYSDAGDTLWHTEMPVVGLTAFGGIKILKNGDIAISGSCSENIHAPQGFFLRYSSAGALVADLAYTEQFQHYPQEIQELDNGNLQIVGSMQKTSMSMFNAFIRTTDSQGNPIETVDYSSKVHRYCFLRSFATYDGGYIIVGSENYGYGEGWGGNILLKVDTFGLTAPIYYDSGNS